MKKMQIFKGKPKFGYSARSTAKEHSADVSIKKSDLSLMEN
jgi:hypothetical protein